MVRRSKSSTQVNSAKSKYTTWAELTKATQTDEKLRRENIKGRENANKTHYEVGKKVRQTIKELGGTMPENLPTPKTSTKQIEKAQENKKLKD